MYKITSNKATILAFAIQNFGANTPAHEKSAALADGVNEFPAIWTATCTKKRESWGFTSLVKAHKAVANIQYWAGRAGVEAPLTIIEKAA